MKITHLLKYENYSKHTKLLCVLRIICIFFAFYFLTDKTSATSEYDYFNLPHAINTDESSYQESEYSNSLPFGGKIIIRPIYIFNKIDDTELEKVNILLSNQLNTANDIFSQIGITIEALAMDSLEEIQVDGYEKGEFDNARKKNDKKIGHLNRYSFPLELTVPVFFVEDLGSSWLLWPLPPKKITTPGATITKWLLSKDKRQAAQAGCFIAYGYDINPDTLAHELGHFMLNDRFFYKSVCSDGTRHHLIHDNQLMHTGARKSGIIDFLPMIKEGYKHDTSPHDIKSMRDSRVNQVEAMYTRSGFVDYTKTVEPDDVDKLRIMMPDYFIDDNSDKQININTRNTSKPVPLFTLHYIDLAWGGDRQTDIALSEYQGVDLDKDIITNIQISSWARIISTKIEYCIDIYFEEPFNYSPYYDGQPMVPNPYSEEPYFMLVMSTKFDMNPDPKAVQVYIYLQNSEDETIYTEELETEVKIESSFSAEQQHYMNILRVIINLEDMQGITHLRWRWQ